jgi:hypothetical protein
VTRSVGWCEKGRCVVVQALLRTAFFLALAWLILFMRAGEPESNRRFLVGLACVPLALCVLMLFPSVRDYQWIRRGRPD